LCILVGKEEGESFTLLPGKEYIVGRHSENDITVKDKHVSRNHFKIQIKGSSYFITDLHSKNGTFVDGKELNPGIPAEIRKDTPIVIGMSVLGIGTSPRSCLKSFLDSAGFRSRASEVGEVTERRGAASVKRNLEFIYNLNNSLMKAKDHKEISRILLDGIFQFLTRIDRCVVITTDAGTLAIRSILYRSRTPVHDPKKVFNREMVEQVLIMKKPRMVNDSTIVENGDDKATETLQLMRIRSALCVPIVSFSGIKGAIYVDSLQRPNGFRKQDLALLNDVGGRAALAIDNLFLQL
jgi:pSer/pThr/pTyr-binding forkhead associated (FHA) protein